MRYMMSGAFGKRDKKIALLDMFPQLREYVSCPFCLRNSKEMVNCPVCHSPLKCLSCFKEDIVLPIVEGGLDALSKCTFCRLGQVQELECVGVQRRQPEVGEKRKFIAIKEEESD
jgi:hypothetical protein